MTSAHPRPVRILDLGIGTGRLAELLLTEFPDAHLTGVDLLETYLERARSRLSKYAGQVSLLHGDVAEFEFSAQYDLIVTSFVFHHLEDEVKRKLYARIFTSLSPADAS